MSYEAHVMANAILVLPLIISISCRNCSAVKDRVVQQEQRYHVEHVE